MRISTYAWVYVSAFEEERDPKPFFDTVRNFYLVKVFFRIFHFEGLRSFFNWTKQSPMNFSLDGFI